MSEKRTVRQDSGSAAACAAGGTRQREERQPGRRAYPPMIHSCARSRSLATGASLAELGMADELLVTIESRDRRTAGRASRGRRPAEVEAAVAAARAAQPAWAALAGAERARILRRAAEILRARNDELAALETRDTGKPIQETRVVDVISGAECLEYFAALAQSASGEHIDLGPAAFGYTRREPLGITAGIGAWNYPLQIACWKSAPALAFGNAMIFKPASLTPLTAVELAKSISRGRPAARPLPGRAGPLRDRPAAHAPSGDPQGLAHRLGRHRQGGDERRLRHDQGRDARARRQVADPRLRRRETRPGRLRARCSATSIPPARCARTARACSCTARSRTRSWRSSSARVGAMKIGDPMDPATQVGSLISEEHMEMVLGYIARGRAEGARIAGRRQAPHGGRAREGLLRRADGVRRLPRRHERSCARRSSAR